MERTDKVSIRKILQTPKYLNAMTIVIEQSTIQKENETYWIEKYWERGFKKPLYRYGTETKGIRQVIKDYLLRKPRIK